MKIISETLTTRGRKKVEFIEYFIEVFKDLNPKENDIKAGEEKQAKLNMDIIFESGSIKVVIGKEDSVRLGSLEFPQVVIRFEGEKDVVEDMLDQFRLNFLTAGG